MLYQIEDIKGKQVILCEMLETKIYFLESIQ